MRILWTTFLAAALGTTGRVVVTAEEDATPPPFFLQDPSDNLCLAGETFKRCSIETLWYVVGSPGSYQIHKRSVDGSIDEEDDGTCLSLKSCKEGDALKLQDVKVNKCSHCGAKTWNILGDNDTGYVLTANDGKTCLVRQDNTVKTTACESTDIPFTPLQLQFASPSDIKTMSSPGARLVGAASDGDKNAIKALLKDEGVDVNVRDWDDLTALVPAASAGHLDICKYLVGEGIDVNAADKDGITALMEASIMGHVKVVEYLIEAGATYDQTAESDITALWLAAGEGRVDVMKVLLEKGADASNARSDGITALMTASVGGHADAIQLLLEHGADAKATDKDGLTAIMNAAEKGSVACLKLLVDKVNDKDHLDLKATAGFNALIVAAAHGNLEAVEYLMQAGASVKELADNSGVTPLMYAAANKHMDVVKLLLDKGGVDIDAKHDNGGTALLEAATAGAIEALKFLMEHGADFDGVDDDGVSALMGVASAGSLEGLKIVVEALKKKGTFDSHLDRLSYSGGSPVMFAAAGGHTECVKELIGLGSNINAIAKATPDHAERLAKMIEEGTVTDTENNVDGVTALHVAAQGGHLDTVNLLLENGAKPAVADDDQRTPLTLAIKGNYGEVALALVKAGADPNTVFTDEEGVEHNLLFDSILIENEEFAKVLIEKGADLYHKDEKGVTTLLQASHRGLLEVVQKLLDAHKAKGGNADWLNTSSEEGVSPIIAASSEGHPEVAKALIAAGANKDAADVDGTSALMAASARGHLEVARELLSAGAAVNVQNNDGHTALMFAFNGKNQVETLFERYSQYLKDADGEGSEEADGGTGPIIREALANHTALVDLLMKNGADANLKDKEGHTAKDFDYHPDADSEVLDKQAKIRDESKAEL